MPDLPVVPVGDDADEQHYLVPDVPVGCAVDAARKTMLNIMILPRVLDVPVVHVVGTADDQHDLVPGVPVGCWVDAAEETMLNIMILSVLC